MRIAVGCPVYERGWILPKWFEGVYNAIGVWDLTFVFAYTDSEDDTLEVIRSNIPVNNTHILVENHGTHGKDRDWTNMARIGTLADMRNHLLDCVADLDVDFYLSLDSDILLQPGSARHLINHVSHAGQADAVAVTTRMAADHSIINAFQRRRDGYLTRVKPGWDGPVDVICAAKLMKIKMARDKSVRYGVHPRGEDFYWSNAAKSAGYQLWLCVERAEHKMVRS
jgi:hypothetical protein